MVLHPQGIREKEGVIQMTLGEVVSRMSGPDRLHIEIEGGVPLPDYITDIPYGDLEHCIYQKIVIKK